MLSFKGEKKRKLWRTSARMWLSLEHPSVFSGNQMFWEEMRIHRLDSKYKFWNVWPFLSPLWTSGPCHGLGMKWQPQNQGAPPSGAQGNRGRDTNLGQITAPSLSFTFPLERSWRWPLLRKARQTQNRAKEEQEWETHNLDLTWIPVFDLIRNLGHEELLSHRWVPSF